MKQQTSTGIDWTELTKALSVPFKESEIKYRPGAVSRDRTKALALPFVDPRVYEDRLNALVPGAWHVDFLPWGESRIICRLTIHDTSRSSTGEGGDSPKEIQGTSAEQQSFRRACSKFGLGRHLYARNLLWMPYDAEKKQLILGTRTQGRSRPSSDALVAQGIGPDRAAAMHNALREVGLALEDHEAFASEVLKRKVVTLMSLTEVDAARVWKAARAQFRESGPKARKAA